jgi:hypothetical protein
MIINHTIDSIIKVKWFFYVKKYVINGNNLIIATSLTNIFMILYLMKEKQSKS